MSDTGKPSAPPALAEGDATAQPGDPPKTDTFDKSEDPEVLIPPPSAEPSADNLLRLAKTKSQGEEAHHAVRLDTLPFHTDLVGSPSANSLHIRYTPRTLALTLLDQGYRFMTVTAPSQLKVRPLTAPRDARRGSPGSATPLEVRRGDVEGEHWVWRSSCHRDASERGTASWDEFRHGLFGMGHSAMEKEYTPNVLDAVTVCTWEVGDVNAWTGVTLGGRFFPAPGRSCRPAR
jgi:hypothetical protein